MGCRLSCKLHAPRPPRQSGPPPTQLMAGLLAGTPGRTRRGFETAPGAAGSPGRPAGRPCRTPGWHRIQGFELQKAGAAERAGAGGGSGRRGCHSAPGGRVGGHPGEGGLPDLRGDQHHPRQLVAREDLRLRTNPHNPPPRAAPGSAARQGGGPRIPNQPAGAAGGRRSWPRQRIDARVTVSAGGSMCLVLHPGTACSGARPGGQHEGITAHKRGGVREVGGGGGGRERLLPRQGWGRWLGRQGRGGGARAERPSQVKRCRLGRAPHRGCVLAGGGG